MGISKKENTETEKQKIVETENEVHHKNSKIISTYTGKSINEANKQISSNKNSEKLSTQITHVTKSTISKKKSTSIHETKQGLITLLHYGGSSEGIVFEEPNIGEQVTINLEIDAVPSYNVKVIEN